MLLCFISGMEFETEEYLFDSW